MVRAVCPQHHQPGCPGSRHDDGQELLLEQRLEPPSNPPNYYQHIRISGMLHWTQMLQLPLCSCLVGCRHGNPHPEVDGHLLGHHVTQLPNTITSLSTLHPSNPHKQERSLSDQLLPIIGHSPIIKVSQDIIVNTTAWPPWP